MIFLLLAALALVPAPLEAHHPTEGELRLEDLLLEAERNNPSLKSAEREAVAAVAERAAAGAALYPELFLGGGPQASRLGADSHSGFSAYAGASWNLYRGGQDAARSEMKRAGERAALLERDSRRAELRREISRLYYEILFSLEASDWKDKALAMNQEQKKLAEAKKRSGFSPETDVIEFELREAVLQSDLKLLQQQAVKLSRELSVLLGRSAPVAALRLFGHLEKPQASGGSRLAPGQNVELRLAELRKERTRAELLEARGGGLPLLDLEARFGKLATEERVFSEKDNYALFLRLRVPLFSGFSTRNATEAASARLEAEELSLVQKRSQLRADQENSDDEIRSLRERLELEEKTLRRSEDYYRLTLSEYRRGVKNSPDVVTASERLLEARLRNLEYRRDLQLARLRQEALGFSEAVR